MNQDSMVGRVSAWIETEYEFIDGSIGALPLRARVEVRRCERKVRLRLQGKDPQEGRWIEHSLTKWSAQPVKGCPQRDLDDAAQSVCDKVLIDAESNDPEGYWGSLIMTNMLAPAPRPSRPMKEPRLRSTPPFKQNQPGGDRRQ